MKKILLLSYFFLFLIASAHASSISHFYTPFTQCEASTPDVVFDEGTNGTAYVISTNKTWAEVNVTGTDVEDYVDNDTSDLDNSTDKGTHSNFTAQQYGLDSNYDILTEQGFSSIDSGLKYAITASTPEITGAPDGNYAEIGKGAVCEVTDYQEGTGKIKQVYFNITYYGTVSGTLAWAYQLDGGGWNNIEDLPEGGSALSPLTRTYNATSLRASWTWDNLNTTDIQFQNNDAGSPENAYTDAIYVTVVAETINYELDLEVQWENADYNETNEKLAIYVEIENNTYSLDATGGYMIVGDGTPDWGSTAGTISFWIKWDTLQGGPIQTRPWGQHYDMETRMVFSYENGTHTFNNLFVNWDGIGSIISDTDFTTSKWYFVAIVWNENTDDLYLYVGDEYNAPTEDTHISGWTGSVSTAGVIENNFMSSQGGEDPTDGHGDDLRYWNTDRTLTEIQSDYDTELTGSETNLKSYFKLNNNFDDIGPDNNDGSGSGSYSFSSDVPFGAPPTENIRVDVWNGTAWQNLFTNLTNEWNNVSVSSYLTSSNFTIRFKGDNETDDTTQDSWNIDATLLHVWTEYYEYVLNITNLSSSTDYEAKLEITSTNGISRLTNFTAHLHDGTTSKQVEISNGGITQSMGSWYSIATSTTIYLSLAIKVNASGNSVVDLRLHVVKSGTTSPEIIQTVTINVN